MLLRRLLSLAMVVAGLALLILPSVALAVGELDQDDFEEAEQYLTEKKNAAEAAEADAQEALDKIIVPDDPETTEIDESSNDDLESDAAAAKKAFDDAVIAAGGDSEALETEIDEILTTAEGFLNELDDELTHTESEAEEALAKANEELEKIDGPIEEVEKIVEEANNLADIANKAIEEAGNAIEAAGDALEAANEANDAFQAILTATSTVAGFEEDGAQAAEQYDAIIDQERAIVTAWEEFWSAQEHAWTLIDKAVDDYLVAREAANNLEDEWLKAEAALREKGIITGTDLDKLEALRMLADQAAIDADQLAMDAAFAALKIKIMAEEVLSTASDFVDVVNEIPDKIYGTDGIQERANDISEILGKIKQPGQGDIFDDLDGSRSLNNKGELDRKPPSGQFKHDELGDIVFPKDILIHLAWNKVIEGNGGMASINLANFSSSPGMVIVDDAFNLIIFEKNGELTEVKKYGFSGTYPYYTSDGGIGFDFSQAIIIESGGIYYQLLGTPDPNGNDPHWGHWNEPIKLGVKDDFFGFGIDGGILDPGLLALKTVEQLERKAQTIDRTPPNDYDYTPPTDPPPTCKPCDPDCKKPCCRPHKPGPTYRPSWNPGPAWYPGPIVRLPDEITPYPMPRTGVEDNPIGWISTGLGLFLLALGGCMFLYFRKRGAAK